MGAAVVAGGPLALARPAGAAQRLDAPGGDRRRGDRRPERRADPPGQGDRLDGLRSVRPRRRAHAFRPQRLLGERPDQRVLRRADRLRPQDDSRARLAVQPPGRRPARCRAGRLDGDVLVSRRPVLGRSGRQRLRACSRRREERPDRGRLSDSVEQVQARRCRTRPHEHLRLDRVARSGRPRVAVRAPARRRLQRGVRRGDDRPGRVEPRLPARLPARPDGLRDLRRLRRAVPHHRRQRAAARGDRCDAARRSHRLADERGGEELSTEPSRFPSRRRRARPPSPPTR